ncbi:MAG: ABC transporter permease subunit [Planctomycetota bacterium]
MRAAAVRTALVALAVVLAALPLVGVAYVWLDPPQARLGAGIAPSFADLLTARTAAGERELGPLPRTLLLAALVCAGSLGLGTALAWLRDCASYRGRAWLAALGLVPFAVPSYLIAMTHRDVFGAVSYRGTGPSVLVLILATSPYVQLLVGARLRRLAGAELDAARLLGARPRQVFARVVLPQLRPALAYSFLLVLLYAVSDFGVVDVLDCEVLTWSLYRAWGRQEVELATLFGLGLVALAVPLILAARLLHGDAVQQRGVGQERPAARLALRGPALAAAYALHAAQIGLGVALPLAVLLRWIFPAAWRAEAWDFGPVALVVAPLATSLALALAAAVLATGMALAPAWSAARRERGGRLAELALFVVQALPGVLVAFGLLAAARGVARASGEPWHDVLRQAGALLVLGLGLRFVGQAFGALKPAVLSIDRRQEESARSLGASALRTLGRVQLPALVPGLRAAGLLIALGVLKELPITLMLQPREVVPLSYRLYGSYGNGNLLETGVVGLVLAGAALALQALAFSGVRASR